MRKVIFAAALAASVVGLSSSAFATKVMHMPEEFGPVYEMPVTAGDIKGHMMHMSVIQDETGAKFVVLPMEEAEEIFGPITETPTQWHRK